MQSPREAPPPPALPAGVPSAPGDRPFDPRRAPTMKIDPLRPAPTAYMSPATAPPQRTAPADAGHEAPVVVRPDPAPRPAAPPAYARPYAPPFSPPPPEPPAFDATMKALIALIVVLAVALAIVLVLLARR
jgi:cell division protein FtsZ